MDQITRRALVTVTLGLTLAAPPASAQDVATVAGRVVHKRSKAGIPGADVLLAPGALRLITDAAGQFRFERVRSGKVSILVRRLGFAPESLVVDLPLAEQLTIELTETPQPLDTVAVTGRDELLARGKLAGFYERKKFGMGRFLEEKDIEKFLTRRLADIIVARMPGTRAVRSAKGGMAAYIATTRMAPQPLISAMKGATRPPPCYPDVYLDGTPVYSSGSEREVLVGGPEVVLFDVNSIDPAQISAIEFYGGPAQMPAQYNRTGSACGALLIWTK